MKKAALWLFLIMVVSYGVAWTAVKDLEISLADIGRIWEDDENDSFFRDGSQTFSQKEMADTKSVNSLNVEFVEADVTLVTDDSENFLIEMQGEYTNNFEHEQPKFKIETQGNDMNVELEETKKEQSIYHDKISVVVTIPRSYTKAVRVESVSGQVSIRGGDYNSVNVDSVSGNIELKEVTSDSVHLESTSGKLTVNGGTGRLDAGSVSGSVFIQRDRLQEDLAIETISGDVEVHLDSFEKVVLEIDTTSGDVTTGHQIKSVNQETGAGRYVLKINTVSGNIYVP